MPHRAGICTSRHRQALVSDTLSCANLYILTNLLSVLVTHLLHHTTAWPLDSTLVTQNDNSFYRGLPKAMKLFSDAQDEPLATHIVAHQSRQKTLECFNTSSCHLKSP